MGGLLARPANPAKIAMATEFVKAAIAKDKVVIFSKSYCPYCTMAKEVRFGHIIAFAWLFLSLSLSPLSLPTKSPCTHTHSLLIRLNFLLVILQQFKKLNQAFTTIELEKRDDCAEIQAALGEITGATSVNENWRIWFFIVIFDDLNQHQFLIVSKFFPFSSLCDHFRCRVYLSMGISLAVVQTWRKWTNRAN